MTAPTRKKSGTREGAIIRKLIRGGGWAFLGKMATYPLGLVLTMLLAKTLSPTDLGGYFLVMSLVMISSIFVQAGLATAMSKFIARSLAENNLHAVKQTIRIGATTFLLTGTLVTLMLINQPGLWLLSQLENGEELFNMLAWIATMAVMFAMVNYCCEILRGFHELSLAAIFDQQLLQRLLLLVGLVVALTFGLQVVLLDVLRMSAGSAFISALFGAFLITRILVQLDNQGKNIETLRLFREAPTFLFMRLNNWLLNSAAIWVLGFSRSFEETALYGAANVVALLVLAPWQVVSSTAGPTITTLHAIDGKQALESVLRTIAAIAAFPGLLLSLACFLFGGDVLSVLFTNEYVAAYSILVVLALGRGISTFFGSPAMLLSMTHHQSAVLRVLLVVSAFTLTGYIYVADIYGAIGVAYVSAISAITQGLLLAIIARQVLGINCLPHFSISDLKQFMSHIR